MRKTADFYFATHIADEWNTFSLRTTTCKFCKKRNLEWLRDVDSDRFQLHEHQIGKGTYTKHICKQPKEKKMEREMKRRRSFINYLED